MRCGVKMLGAEDCARCWRPLSFTTCVAKLNDVEALARAGLKAEFIAFCCGLNARCILFCTGVLSAR